MSTQYRLVQSGKTASGGCSAGQGSSEEKKKLWDLVWNFVVSVHLFEIILGNALAEIDPYKLMFELAATNYV
jgi:hypothetical protein